MKIPMLEAFRARPDMSLEWSCCGTPMRDPAETPLGSRNGCELLLASCCHCGAHWASIASRAGAALRWQPVPRRDAVTLLAAPTTAQALLLEALARERP